jgi:hypothetical protein
MTFAGEYLLGIRCNTPREEIVLRRLFNVSNAEDWNEVKGTEKKRERETRERSEGMREQMKKSSQFVLVAAASVYRTAP